MDHAHDPAAFAARLNDLGQRATAALGAGDLESAASLADQALAIAPNLPAALAMRATIAARRGRPDNAERDMTAAIRGYPSPPPQWSATLAQVYRSQGRLDRAVELLRDVHRRHPAAEIITSNLAELLATTRRAEEAHALLAEAVQRGADRPGLLAQYGRVCRILNRPADALAPLQRAAGDTRQPASGRQMALFELGLTLDTLERYDEAFDAFSRANALEPRAFDGAAHADAIDQSIDAWTALRLAGLPRREGAGRGVVFIVGMRRTGTTLCEQILAAHPAVASAGEVGWLRRCARRIDPEPARRWGLITHPGRCTAHAVAEASREYLARADAQRKSTEHLTDKMPANYKLLGLVQLALPAARIVWCRRDPADTCLSCYMQPFRDNSACADLHTLAHYHHDCERLMAHWRRTLGLPVFTLQYETLIAQPEATVQALLEFLGLPHHEDCLQFHAVERIARTRSTDQVARELYSRSIGRAQRYRPHLAALAQQLDRLAEERQRHAPGP